MFDQDPPFLKIFAGVGKVTVVTKEAGIGKGDTYIDTAYGLALLSDFMSFYILYIFAAGLNITLKSSAY